LSNFSKEFNHWLAVSDNEAQRVCVWLVAENPLAIFRRMGKLINSSEFPRGNSVAINYTRLKFVIH
jgi:hypothetical protein